MLLMPTMNITVSSTVLNVGGWFLCYSHCALSIC